MKTKYNPDRHQLLVIARRAARILGGYPIDYYYRLLAKYGKA